MGTKKAAGTAFMGAEEVMRVLGIKKSKAYDIVRQLRQELKDAGYMEPPAGKIQRKYFCERFFLDVDDIEEIREILEK